MGSFLADHYREIARKGKIEPAKLVLVNHDSSRAYPDSIKPGTVVSFYPQKIAKNYAAITERSGFVMAIWRNEHGEAETLEIVEILKKAPRGYFRSELNLQKFGQNNGLVRYGVRMDMNSVYFVPNDVAYVAKSSLTSPFVVNDIWPDILARRAEVLLFGKHSNTQGKIPARGLVREGFAFSEILPANISNKIFQPDYLHNQRHHLPLGEDIQHIVDKTARFADDYHRRKCWFGVDH